MADEAITFTFGALAPKLHEQMGWPEDNHVVQHLQADADAITRLSVRGYLNEKETAKARRALVRLIKDNMKYPGF